MNQQFIDQCFRAVDLPQDHMALIHEIDHYIETFNISDRDFDDLVSATIGELFSREDDVLLADLTKQQAEHIYNALLAKYG